jgi:hypothetical protein
VTGVPLSATFDDRVTRLTVLGTGATEFLDLTGVLAAEWTRTRR